VNAGGKSKPKGSTAFVVTRANGTVHVIHSNPLARLVASLKGALARWQ